jgi:hypothetical protein
LSATAHICRSALPEASLIGHYGRVLGGRIAIAAVVLVVGATACSSGHSTALLRPSASPKACDVISPVEVERVLASPVVRGNQVACIYITQRLPSSAAAATLQQSTPADLQRFFAAERAGQVRVAPGSTSKRPAPRAISGVGDEALWDGQWLFVRAGKWLLGISVHDGNSPDLTRSTALARLGLQRLSA